MTLHHSRCVFCGARAGHDPALDAAARAVGRCIADLGWRLVYGAGDVGPMGEVARAAQDAGALTIGLIPTHLLSCEQGRRNLSRLVFTEVVHERKKT